MTNYSQSTFIWTVASSLSVSHRSNIVWVGHPTQLHLKHFSLRVMIMTLDGSGFNNKSRWQYVVTHPVHTYLYRERTASRALKITGVPQACCLHNRLRSNIWWHIFDANGNYACRCRRWRNNDRCGVYYECGYTVRSGGQMVTRLSNG